jgi:hypothetical protein
MDIEWSLQAKTDLQYLNSYISKDSPFYARQKDPPGKTAGYSGNDLNLKSPYPLFQRGNPSIKLRTDLNGYPVASYWETQVKIPELF